MESWKLISKETRERLRKDSLFSRQAFERILGPPKKGPTSRGFFVYLCPFVGCSGTKSGHLGVRYDLNLNDIGDVCGQWNCVRCGTKGNDFLSFCDALDSDPRNFVDSVDELEEYQIKRVAPREVITPEGFASVWSWIQKHASLSEEHRDMLLLRGVENVPWFTMPGENILQEALKLFGRETLTDAGVYFHKGRNSSKPRTSLYAQEGRLVILYPEGTYARTYLKGSEKKILGPEGISPLVYKRVRSKGRYLVITEGEIKAEASWQAGVSTLGLPGIFSCHEDMAEIIQETCKSWYTENQSATKVRIVFDRETKPEVRRFVDKAIARVYDIIREKTNNLDSCMQPEIEELVLPSLGEKTDIDSYIRHHAETKDLTQVRRRWREFVSGQRKD